jgi:hypothetical protein
MKSAGISRRPIPLPMQPMQRKMVMRGREDLKACERDICRWAIAQPATRQRPQRHRSNPHKPARPNLRPLEEPVRPLVLDVRLRLAREEPPRVPAPPRASVRVCAGRVIAQVEPSSLTSHTVA